MRWNDRRQGIELLRRIATRVDLGGRQSGMTQPQRHLPDVLCCLQNDHRAGVPEHVRRDALLVEAGLLSSGGRGMLLEQIGEAPSAQRLSIMSGLKTSAASCGRWRKSLAPKTVW